METLGAAGIIDRNSCDKTALAGTDLGLEKFPASKDRQRAKLMGAHEELLSYLVPTRGGDDDAGFWPGEQAPEGRRGQYLGSFSGAVTGDQSGGMAFGEVAESFGLPRVGIKAEGTSDKGQNGQFRSES